MRPRTIGPAGIVILGLLDVDNGVFIRNQEAADLARAVVEESLRVAIGPGLELDAEEIMDQILKISKGSDGQLISTLQDIRTMGGPLRLNP